MGTFLRLHTIFRFTLFCCVSAIFIYMYSFIKSTDHIRIDMRFMPSTCNTGKPVNHKMHTVCTCERGKKPLFMSPYQTESACSDHASSRGPGQKVISYSFYGTVRSKYFEGTEVNIKSVAEYYPGWVMRLYNNISLSDPKEVQILCKLWCSNPHFDLCDVNNLPQPLCNQSEVFGMIWRFFVMGDPLVDKFMIRDIDSEIYPREVHAVQEWLKSGHQWHTMRDNPNHYLAILGGLWGGTNSELNVTTNMRNEMIHRGKHWRRGYDQDLIGDIVLPHAIKDIIQHDSYRCEEFNNSLPWPSKREGNFFVGSTFPWKKGPKYVPKCPEMCRPVGHKDWVYC